VRDVGEHAAHGGDENESDHETMPSEASWPRRAAFIVDATVVSVHGGE
jgi:hypothetical protein